MTTSADDTWRPATNGSPWWGATVDDDWTHHGVRVAIIDNGVLRVEVATGRGGDIVGIRHLPTATELLFRTPAGLRRDVLAADGDPVGRFLDHYPGGWQTLLPNPGWPARLDGATLGQHGEFALLPWRSQVLDAGPDRAWLSLSAEGVRTPLRIDRTIKLQAGSAALTVSDVITNRGRDSLEFGYGHHMVFGWPFLTAASKLELAGARIHVDADPQPGGRLAGGSEPAEWPWAHGEHGPVDLRDVLGPEARSADLAYLTDLVEPAYRVTSPERGIDVEVRFPSDVFEAVWLWQVFGGAGGYPWWGRTYSLGVEPVSGWPNRGVRAQKESSTVLALEGGGSLEATIVLEVSHHDDADVGDPAEAGRTTEEVSRS